MKTIKKIFFSFFILSLCFAAFNISNETAAADNFWDQLKADMIYDADRPEDAVSSDFRTAIRGFINYFLGFLGLIAVGMVVYAGVLMVTAQGEEEQVGKGKKILIWASAGIVLIMLSYAIVTVIIGAGDSVA